MLGWQSAKHTECAPDSLQTLVCLVPTGECGLTAYRVRLGYCTFTKPQSYKTAMDLRKLLTAIERSL